MGKDTCEKRYPGHRPFGCDYDQERIATGWGNLATGTSQHCNFQKDSLIRLLSLSVYILIKLELL